MVLTAEPLAKPVAGSRRLGWAKRLKHSARAVKIWLIARGIRMMCGSAVTIDAEGLAEFPLISAGLRLGWLRALRTIGIHEIKSTSGLGYPFLCRIGDLSEHPFYHRQAYRKELELCAAWLREGPSDAVVYDIGANDGFFSCQLAQMLAESKPLIYAFEAVPLTFAGLVTSVQKLGLSAKVIPVAAAVGERAGPTRLSFSPQNSLCAQVTPQGLNRRAGSELAHAVGVTLTDFQASARALPALLKIDVEGSEPAVLRGARTLLSQPQRPAVLFEFNPTTLAECHEPATVFSELLEDYRFHYVDDLEGQKLAFGASVPALSEITWICNIFAVPKDQDSEQRWTAALLRAEARLAR